MKKNLLSQTEILRYQEPLSGATYYAVTLLADAEGRILTSCQSQFVRWDDFGRRQEIREACLVNPQKLRGFYKSIDEPAVLVNSKDDLILFLLIGGHGVIEKSLAEQHLSQIIGPSVVVRSVSKGFVDIVSAPPEWSHRAPSRKGRMRVLKRDKLKCRICGRSPSDYVDVELHLHHVLPWSRGGLTEDDNLVTICKTCHDGLDPHFDPELFSMVGIDPYLPKLETSDEYRRGVQNYRQALVRAFRAYQAVR